MYRIRSFAIIAIVALLVGVLVVSVGVFFSQSDDDDTVAETTPTPAVEEPADQDSNEQAEDVDDPQEEVEADPADGEIVDEDEPVDDQSDDENEPEAEPDEAPEPQQEPLTEEELQEHQPNELGQIMVLMYHRIEQDPDPNDEWTRSPEQFREDLQWLYDNNFYIIPIRDYINNEIHAPAGKRPVVLTFDDGTVGQFRMVEHDDGSVTIDPDSAVGILEEFFDRYDDFGRGGLFSILPLAPLSWPDADEQEQYAEEKLAFLLENGYELGNHTVGHVNFLEVSDDEIKAELAQAEDYITDLAPDAEIDVLAVPFGIYPEGGDTTIFEGWEYEGRQYELHAALMVGAEPAPSPVHVDFDPMWIPRINGDDEELGRWFSFLEENPGIIYVSDGNPDTITVPEDLHPNLVGALDEAKAEGKEIIRY